MIDEIIKNIQQLEQINFDDSFNYCNICSKLLRGTDTSTNGRKILVNILDNWNKVEISTHQMWIELLEAQGFYPYLEKENFSLEFTTSKLRKEMSKSDNLGYYLHDEQRYVKNLIDSGKNVIVSAPTSFGKSLLIEEIVASKKHKNIVIIQPTLALLDETRKKLKKYTDEYKIIVRTSQEASQDIGNIFLLTAERVMEYHELPPINFLIIDEFYKLSANRDDERSDVLNNAFHLLLKRDNMQFYLLGPNIDGISEGFTKEYNAVFYKTDYSLVEQNIINLYNNDFGTRGKKKENRINALFKLLLTLKDEQSMIYCSSPDSARKTSKLFYEFLKTKVSEESTNIALIEWIEENITKRWSLIDLLKYKISFHDGALQKHITSSLVKYFNEKKISFLFCTSTIIEGVNTNTKNIIIFDNKKGGQPIDYFDYSNIKGRAGRMMIHYTGMVYNFNPPIKKEDDLIVDIPFFQQSPIKDEVLIHLEDNEIIAKDSEQYKNLQKIPQQEKELIKQNGLLVYGQKRVLDILKIDVKSNHSLIEWSNYPQYKQLQYVLSLGWKYLLKDSETKYPMTLNKLVKITFDYGQNQDIRYLVKSNYDFMIQNERYENMSKNDIFDEAVRDAFNILRHWFQYKVPKLLRTISLLQEFICKENGLKSGNYSFYADKIESDFVRDNLSILLEYGIPKSAIKKLESVLDKDLTEEQVIKIVKSSKVIETSDFLAYEKEKILDSI